MWGGVRTWESSRIGPNVAVVADVVVRAVKTGQVCERSEARWIGEKKYCKWYKSTPSLTDQERVDSTLVFEQSRLKGVCDELTSNRENTVALNNDRRKWWNKFTIAEWKHNALLVQSNTKRVEKRGTIDATRKVIARDEEKQIVKTKVRGEELTKDVLEWNRTNKIEEDAILDGGGSKSTCGSQASI